MLHAPGSYKSDKNREKNVKKSILKTYIETWAKKVPKRSQKGCQEGLKIEILGVKMDTRSGLSTHSVLQGILKRIFMKFWEENCEF